MDSSPPFYSLNFHQDLNSMKASSEDTDEGYASMFDQLIHQDAFIVEDTNDITPYPPSVSSLHLNENVNLNEQINTSSIVSLPSPSTRTILKSLLLLPSTSPSTSPSSSSPPSPASLASSMSHPFLSFHSSYTSPPNTSLPSTPPLSSTFPSSPFHSNPSPIPFSSLVESTLPTSSMYPSPSPTTEFASSPSSSPPLLVWSRDTPFTLSDSFSPFLSGVAPSSSSLSTTNTTTTEANTLNSTMAPTLFSLDEVDPNSSYFFNSPFHSIWFDSKQEEFPFLSSTYPPPPPPTTTTTSTSTSSTTSFMPTTLSSATSLTPLSLPTSTFVSDLNSTSFSLKDPSSLFPDLPSLPLSFRSSPLSQPTPLLDHLKCENVNPFHSTQEVTSLPLDSPPCKQANELESHEKEEEMDEVAQFKKNKKRKRDTFITTGSSTTQPSTSSFSSFFPSSISIPFSSNESSIHSLSFSPDFSLSSSSSSSSSVLDSNSHDLEEDHEAQWEHILKTELEMEVPKDLPKSKYPPELKKKIRMIKNRLAASESRRRAKAQLESLQSLNHTLTMENQRLTQALASSHQEIQHLKSTLHEFAQALDLLHSAHAAPSLGPRTSIRSFGAFMIFFLILLIWIPSHWILPSPFMRLDPAMNHGPSTSMHSWMSKFSFYHSQRRPSLFNELPPFSSIASSHPQDQVTVYSTEIAPWMSQEIALAVSQQLAQWDASSSSSSSSPSSSSSVCSCSSSTVTSSSTSSPSLPLPQPKLHSSNVALKYTLDSSSCTSSSSSSSSSPSSSSSSSSCCSQLTLPPTDTTKLPEGRQIRLALKQGGD